MKNRIKIKLNKDLYGFKKDAIIDLPCDDEGVPFNTFWRRRLLDADYDNCVEVIKNEAALESEKPKQTSKNKGE